MEMKAVKSMAVLLLVSIISLVLLTSCRPGSGQSDSADRVIGSSSSVLRIISGSENAELEPILEKFAEQEGIEIQMSYQGSLDIMRLLEGEEIDYDAVWPASSIWLTMGDTKHRVQHTESVSISPVVFGIRKNLAEELGFVGREVSVGDLLAAIQSGKLRFCMTSATQSNSGASAYIGFLYALLGNPEVITSEDLQSEELKTQMRELLSGVDRSSGSSDWLKDMFLEGNYDAMVNYECLVISTNQKLEEEGKEPLYVVYPYDGLSIADSPLGYVDHGDETKEEAFLAFQENLLSGESQSAIEATGRRITANGVSDENKDVFNSSWGIDTERILSPIQMPSADVLMEALNVYQTSFKKPSLNIYCLDFSGSMRGTGESQLKEAMSQILIQENARKNLLQANEGEVNIAILFSDGIRNILSADGYSDEALQKLYDQIAAESPGGGTDIYTAAARAYEIASGYDLNDYTPAVILMSDGVSSYNKEVFDSAVETYGNDIPVFSITFGDADPDQLEELAEMTGARVFDGTEDLTEAFRGVKGYN